MASFDYRPSAVSKPHVTVDQGLRQHMLRIYNYMASGVLLSGIVAWFSFQQAVVMDPTGAILGLTAWGQTLFASPLAFVVMLAPLGFILALSFGVNRMQASTLQTLFWVFAGVMGLSLSSIFMVYAGGSIARVFFITAGAFAALSLYGYTTRKNLSGFGTFLFMGLIGLVLASVVNIFLQSSMLSFVVSVVGVLVFAGLTAYDTQRIKEMYDVSDSPEIASKKSIMGALSLYLDFINLFLMLLRLFAERR
ncbi:MAG: Bax inhibitor-1/YccA family protein [Alphaproteobacteria bacterium GM202ARS2]|nr:Bax inhibitor-1/YccA family protein [Alphaproteobacteria bacterium GM202ARS2]